MTALTEPVIGLAATPRPWALRLHEHIADHGGARVRATVLTASEALAEQFEVLVADDRTSFLSARLVADLHRAGRTVLGLFDPEDPQAKSDLLDWGVDEVLPCDTAVEDLLAAARALARTPPPAPEPFTPREPATASAWTVTVCGPPGAGRTETALTLALALSRHGTSVLMETEEPSASLAPRLGLPPYPNLRLALELERQAPGSSGRTLQRLRPELGLLVAGPLPAHLPPPPAEELTAVARVAAGSADWLVLDTDRPQLWSGPMSTVVVAAGTPVGVLRAATWLRALASDLAAPHLVLNHAPASSFRNWEAAEELGRVRPLASVTCLPSDERVTEAVWRGMPATRGRFVRALAGLAERLCVERAAAAEAER